MLFCYGFCYGSVTGWQHIGLTVVFVGVCWCLLEQCASTLKTSQMSQWINQQQTTSPQTPCTHQLPHPTPTSTHQLPHPAPTSTSTLHPSRLAPELPACWLCHPFLWLWWRHPTLGPSSQEQQAGPCSLSHGGNTHQLYRQGTQIGDCSVPCIW